MKRSGEVVRTTGVSGWLSYPKSQNENYKPPANADVSDRVINHERLSREDGEMPPLPAQL